MLSETRLEFRRPLLLLGVCVLLMLHVAQAAGNGRKGAKREYRGEAAGVAFSAELEPILFQLHTVNNRYRVIRIRLLNKGTANLALSRQRDKVTVAVENQEIEGILDLGARDASMWDGFDAALRTYLAYPTDVPKGEEDSVFVFLPADRVKTAPIALTYTVAAIGQPLTLRPPAARAD